MQGPVQLTRGTVDFDAAADGRCCPCNYCAGLSIHQDGSTLQQYFLYAAKLIDKIEGSFIEAGFGNGASASMFVGLMNKNLITKRNIWLYDSFEGFPQPSPEDKSVRNPQKGEWKRSIQPALDIKKYASQNLSTEVEVIKGYFEETIPTSYGSEPIAMLHLDCDLYNSYKVCLEGLYDKVAPGGLILFDDYRLVGDADFDAWPGASKAVDNFFKKIDIQLVKAQFDPKIYKGWENKPKYFAIKER